MRDAVLALSNSIASSIAIKATVILLLGILGVSLLRGTRAAVRHALLAATFAALLLLPLVSAVVPPMRIGMRTASRAGAHVDARLTLSDAVASRQSSMPPFNTLLLWGWMAGTALFLLPVVTGLWQIRGLRRSALPWRPAQPLVDSLGRDLGIGRQVKPLLHETLGGPMTCGMLRPVVVLPGDAQSWNRADLTRALIHELEHVRRDDWIIRSLARVVCAIYWFHPLAWIAWRRLELEAERSCDDAVLAQSEATEYAGQLVALARRVSGSPLLAMANRADLSVRVNAVLDSGQHRGRVGTPALLLAAAAAVLMLSIAPLQMVAAPQGRPTLAAAASLVVVNVTVTDPNGQVVQGLTANDFVLTDNNVPQTIAIFRFQTLEDAPGYYELGYYPRNPQADGSYHTLGVTGKRDDMAQLRFRKGYYAKAAQPPSVAAGASSSVDARGSSVDAHESHVRDTSIRQPTVIFKVDPEYSEEARRAKYSGTVILSADITPDGRASKIQVVKGLGLGLDEKAIGAVSQWRFNPGTKDGQPITVSITLQVSFRLL
jgi:TonB family protein